MVTRAKICPEYNGKVIAVGPTKRNPQLYIEGPVHSYDRRFGTRNATRPLKKISRHFRGI